jgi:hypothetical protein
MRVSDDRDLFERVFGTVAPSPLIVDPEKAIETLKTSAGECFGCRFVSAPLTDEEWRAIESSK